MNYKQKGNLLTWHRNDGSLYLALPPLLLIIAVVGLLILTVSVCIKFTKGPLSTAALLRQLQILQAKFMQGKTIDPDTQRQEMEILQNKLKTSSDPALISANSDLKQLFSSNCQAIQSVLERPLLENRTSWIKLNTMMLDFNSHYFDKQVNQER
jgi:hypothetical protein